MSWLRCIEGRAGLAGIGLEDSALIGTTFDRPELDSIFIIPHSSEPSHTFSYGGCRLGTNGGRDSGNGGGGGGVIGGGKSRRSSNDPLSLLLLISSSRILLFSFRLKIGESE